MMEPINTIRGFIFLTASLVVLIFPQQVVDWQRRTMNRIFGRVPDSMSKDKGLRGNRITAIIFLFIAVGFFAYAYWN